ncbi:Cap-specific mRNA (Nucleoside-2'-O-)-methyltransferase 1 [Fasciola gigantica]|uniref:Cap-specific mRNA (nucleoside-2'-O-)-methyltransferase 1 n=1 Tax=Fasciola gigantica TaxID=46835 RepID=A0A504YZ95_FASGI|nr:Cap-specific mRNA (Nucleoside-2'-O-)-methyltransferase 1 [Fasciola gigantica]
MSKNTMGTNSLKRKIDDGVTEPAWNIMRNMGYEKGKGLGTHAQGIVEPVDVSKQKGRRGLGLVPKSKISAYASDQLYRSADSTLVWKQDTDTVSVDDDKIWYWKPHINGVSGRVEPRSSLKSIFLSPDDPGSVGPPIREMDEQFKFCSQHLLRELLSYKDQLDNIPNILVTESHQRCNPYEQIKKGIFMNRAAMKLANIDTILDGLLTNSAAPEEILYFADVCAGPGGFSEYLLWRRCNTKFQTSHSSDGDSDNPTDQSSSSKNPVSETPHLTAKGFGLTLIGNCDFRLNDFLAGPSEAFFPHYGQTKDGDITQWANLASFASLIDRATTGQGVHVLVADGGFDVSGQQNLQEVLSKRIYLCQCLCALIVLRPGGHFLTKLFDVFTEFSVGLIYLIGQLFEEVAIIKPVTSRPANSERYLFCKSLISPLPGMAGCPPSPKTNAKSDDPNSLNPDRVEIPRKMRKLPGQGRIQHNTLSDGDREFGVLERQRAGFLGELIEYLLSVNERINSFQTVTHNFGTSRPKQDVIRLCDMDVLVQDEPFFKFITRMNKQFAIHQCIALSKLLAFAHDPRLVDSQQTEMKVGCLERWKIATVERRPVPWPLMTCNRSPVIHELLGDKEKVKSLNMLPKEYMCQWRTDWCTSHHLSEIDRLVDSRIVLVCGTPSMSAGSIPSKPMLIYSRGRHDTDKYVTLDGEEWTQMKDVVPLCQPPLPPGTLIWGQATYEYVAKNGRRRYALHIIDVVAVYGYDCRNLPYRQRMNVAQRMCEVVNFPGMQASCLRVPPMLAFHELPSYVHQLPLLQCKDASGDVPMHRLPDGMLFRPNNILLVKHLAEPWTEAVSRTSGQIYYFNPQKSTSTFSIPADQFLSFTQTHFLQVPWTENQATEINVSHLARTVEHFNRISQDND